MFTIKVVCSARPTPDRYDFTSVYHVVIDSLNGRRMFSSETYASKSNARRAARKFHRDVTPGSSSLFTLDPDLL